MKTDRSKLSLTSCLCNRISCISFELHFAFPNFSNIHAMMIQRYGNMFSMPCFSHSFSCGFQLRIVSRLSYTPTLDVDQTTNQNIEKVYKVLLNPLLMIDAWKIEYLASKLRRIEIPSCHTLFFFPNNLLSNRKLKIHNRASLSMDSLIRKILRYKSFTLSQ